MFPEGMINTMILEIEKFYLKKISAFVSLHYSRRLQKKVAQIGVRYHKMVNLIPSRHVLTLHRSPR